MSRVAFIAAVLLTAQVAVARGITQEELLGTWIMGIADGTVYGTFKSDFTYSITHGKRPHAHGSWSLSQDGTKLQMTNGESGDTGTNIIGRFDGRLLHITIDNGEQGEWRKLRKQRSSAPSPRRA